MFTAPYIGLSGLSRSFCLFGASGLFRLSRLCGLFGLSSMIFDETRDDSANLAACLLIPSRKSILQRDEYAKGKISTQHSQAALRKREERLVSLVYLVCLVCLVELD
jgi:hypothetical protein